MTGFERSVAGDQRRAVLGETGGPRTERLRDGAGLLVCRSVEPARQARAETTPRLVWVSGRWGH